MLNHEGGLYGNEFHRLPDQTPTTWTGPVKVVHYVLTVKQDASPPYVKFFIDKGTLVNPANDIEQYVHCIAADAPDPAYCSTLIPAVEERALPFSIETPYDIVVRQPSCIILQLDRAINWEFSKGDYAITSKFDYGDSNFGMGCGYRNGTITRAGPVQSEGCNVAYFYVNRRASHESQMFNFHVDFKQTDNQGVTRRLKTIFDPDIKNDGGGFP
jgi:hypothetical protein